MRVESKSCLRWFLPPVVIVKKKSRHFSNQSEVKPKPNPNLTHPNKFSRGLRQPHVYSGCDWFTELYMSFVIGCFSIDFINSIDVLSIGFTPLKLGSVFKEGGLP